MDNGIVMPRKSPGPQEKVNLVYFMIGLMLATVVYTNIIVFAGPSEAQVAPQDLSLSEENTSSIEMPILAVNGNRRFGDVANMRIQSTEGVGDVYIRTSPYVDPTIQQSSNTAYEIAKRESVGNNGDSNMIITYDISTSFLAGESAGAAKTIGMLALLDQKDIDEDVVITGAIGPNGRIGHVNGIPEKIEAAAREGFSKILIPRGQRISRMENIFRFTRNDDGSERNYDIVEYAEEKYGIEVVEITDISDAIEHAIL